MGPEIVISLGTIFVVVLFALLMRRRKSRRLHQRFGPEYDRVILEQQGNSYRAEALLAAREKRMKAFSLRALSAAQREAYALEWMTVQRCFVENPSAAVGCTDRLINRAMTDRGYPQSDFEQRVANISVSYPSVVQNYREAHEIEARYGDGHATTEDLRQAIIYYRSLFYELLEPSAEELARDELLDPVWDEMYDPSLREAAGDVLLEAAPSKPLRDHLLEQPRANELPEPAIFELIDAKRRRAARERAS
jgi:hypothetical protein